MTIDKPVRVGSLFLAMYACFVLGLYAASTFKYNEPVELYRWIITITVGLFFLVNFFVGFRGEK